MGPQPRQGSPTMGGSILITSAPKSDMIVAAAGPAIQLAQSITFRPVNRLSVTVSRLLVGENNRPRRGEHAPYPVAHRDLSTLHLRWSDPAHLPHTLLQRVHPVHPGMHVRQ